MVLKKLSGSCTVYTQVLLNFFEVIFGIFVCSEARPSHFFAIGSILRSIREGDISLPSTISIFLKLGR